MDKKFVDFTAVTEAEDTDVLLIHDGNGVKKITKKNFLGNIHGGNSGISRWLRFNPLNKKGLIIKAGTSIKLSNGDYAYYEEDTQVNLSSQLGTVGADYLLYINDDLTFSASKTERNSGVKIGRFHTLCVDAGTNLTMKAPAAPSSGLTAGDPYLVKPYREDEDKDFHDFYNVTISGVTVQSYYDLVTMAHPLAGFAAGDILPESVFCNTFKPNTLFEDAMVYDKTTDKVIDVYLQSGMGHGTRSAYNQNHTVSRQAWNHMGDMLAVGKQLLSDHEFTSAALGSNEATNIAGGADVTKVGGHTDSAGRRMISAIGCEEMCGYLWQWLRDLPGNNGSTTWAAKDGNGSFGQEYFEDYVLLAGGSWSNAAHCGSRGRHSSDVRSLVGASVGGRGSSQVIRCQ